MRIAGERNPPRSADEAAPDRSGSHSARNDIPGTGAGLTVIDPYSLHFRYGFVIAGANGDSELRHGRDRMTALR